MAPLYILAREISPLKTVLCYKIKDKSIFKWETSKINV
nr:hypothetical protein Itr_chr01CG00430 [Ipomoea trifida]